MDAFPCQNLDLRFWPFSPFGYHYRFQLAPGWLPNRGCPLFWTSAHRVGTRRTPHAQTLGQTGCPYGRLFTQERAERARAHAPTCGVWPPTLHCSAFAHLPATTDRQPLIPPADVDALSWTSNNHWQHKTVNHSQLTVPPESSLRGWFRGPGEKKTLIPK